MNPGQSFIAEITGKYGWLIIVSVVACLSFVVMTVSQFIKALLSKNTTSISVFYAVILPITNTLIAAYDLTFFCIGILDGSFLWSLLLPAVLNGLISAYGLMILKIIHVRAAEKKHMSEYAYFLKYLKQKSYLSKKKNKKK